MARLPRLTVAGYAHHVILRGNNRQAIFVDDQDRQDLLAMLAQYAAAEQVEVHAYVLMDNHLHLLLTPRHDQAMPRLMQALGRRYVRQFNRRHGRSGTLWEGRYRATLIDSERYLLACMVYIELNPVRASLVAQARDHPWSSHAHHIGARQDRLVTPHPLYWALGNTPFAREAAYAALVAAGLQPSQQQTLTDAALKAWALGGDDFIAELQRQTGRRVRAARPGRPRKPSGPGPSQQP